MGVLTMYWLVGVVVRRYIGFLIIIITYPYTTCIFAAVSLLLCSFIKHFFVLVLTAYTHLIICVYVCMCVCVFVVYYIYTPWSIVRCIHMLTHYIHAHLMTGNLGINYV